MCTGAYRCVQVERVIMPYLYVHIYTISFHVFVLQCLVLCRNLTLTLFKKVLFVRNEVFSNEINFCCHEIGFFDFNLFSRTKVIKKGFNFNQIES